MRALLIIAGLLAVISCARVMAPPGGVPDQEPPRIIETEPAQNASAAAFINSNRPVRIVFDQTISERSPREMVMVSPETGEVHVDRDGNVLEVTIDGGWKEGLVYHVTVLPGIVDRRGNARQTTYELVFSTGAQIFPTAVAGLVTDRITGRPVSGARMEAISRVDSTVYTTVTDSIGFFAFRSLPIGLYETRAYSDQNRNRILDDTEARAISSANVGHERDTVSVELRLLAQDTTPARLLRAEIRDTLQVRLSFDDYLNPSGELPPIRITAWQLPDSTVMISGGTVLSPRDYDAQRAPQDSAAADSAAITPPPVPPEAARPPEGPPLPFNELVWVPAQPLVPGARYRIMVTGYRNIQNVANGGGSVVATAPARPAERPPTEAADSTRP